jgi:hypothetical protein
MENIHNLLNYLISPLDDDRKLLFYRVNQISRERMGMYYSFTKTLYKTIEESYLGDGYLSSDDKLKHFNWSWLKTVELFKEEKIYFFEFGELYDYFKIMFNNCFYNKTEEVPDILEFWSDLFDYDKPKTMAELEDLVEMYRLFNKSFYV